MQTNATTTDYFLGDALGSVRQLTNQTGAITYARAYDPYGVVTQTSGASQTAYGYTGEFTSNNMVYLRSRMYSPGMGRFLTRDTWGGDANSPMSYNKWNYVGSNPLNRIDPTGQCWYPNAINGGISYDVNDPSPALCSWFINVFQKNGITIPVNATPTNWLDSIPPEQRALILAFTTCVFKNQYLLSASHEDTWMAIRFYTRPKWQYYSTWSTGASDVKFKLFGAGGKLDFLCENVSHNCTTSGSFDLGPGVGFSILGYHLELSTGLGINIDRTGTIQVGGTAEVGPCGLFVNFLRISIECTVPPVTKEWGWTRDALPQDYLGLVKSSVVRNISYEDLAKRLPFNPNMKVYYRVEDTGSRIDLGAKYFGNIEFEFE